MLVAISLRGGQERIIRCANPKLKHHGRETELLITFKVAGGKGENQPLAAGLI